MINNALLRYFYWILFGKFVKHTYTCMWHTLDIRGHIKHIYFTLINNSNSINSLYKYMLGLGCVWNVQIFEWLNIYYEIMNNFQVKLMHFAKCSPYSTMQHKSQMKWDYVRNILSKTSHAFASTRSKYLQKIYYSIIIILSNCIGLPVFILSFDG